MWDMSVENNYYAVKTEYFNALFVFVNYLTYLPCSNIYIRFEIEEGLLRKKKSIILML